MAVSAPRLSKAERAERAERMFDLLKSGQNYAEIARTTGSSIKVVEGVLRLHLNRIPIAGVTNFAKLQIGRLEKMIEGLKTKVGQGDLAAIDRILKMIDRLDRYHGFRPGATSEIDEGEGAKAKFLKKIADAKRRDAAAKSRTE
jgi:hypothetical protein